MLLLKSGTGVRSKTKPRGSGIISGLRSFFGSFDPEKTLTEFCLSELDAMAGAKVDETGPSLNVGTGGEFVQVPTVDSSSLASVVVAARTKYYASQSAKSLLKDFLSSIL